MPQVAARYRTTKKTAVVGESLAGLFVVETFLLEPDLFDTYVAVDPSLWWNDGKLAADAAALLRQRPKLEKRLYLASSGEDRGGVTRRFADALRAAAPPGVRWTHDRLPDETHATVFHPAALRAFRTVFKPEPSGRSLSDDQAAAAFYRPDEVQSVHLRVADADLKRMLAALPELVEVPASFRWRDVTAEHVSVRFKGNSSSDPKQTHKRSFLVKFDKGRRFFGLRQASFDNGVQFGSLFSEPVVTDILRDHGVPAHRCNYARLYVNGEYRGVYVNVERIDESFVATHLPDAGGALFKVDKGGPGCNLQFLGDDPALYLKTFAAKTKSAAKDPARLVAFIKLINETRPDEFAKALESRMEVDDFLRVTAVMLFAGAFDQLTGWNPHNYFLYHDRTRDRWRYLPWDLDVGFCETAFGQIRVLDDWHAAWPVPRTGAPNPLLERIVADPVLLERYRKEARKILDKSFEPDRLCAVIDAKYRLIGEDLKADPFPHRRATVPGDRGYDDVVESMKAFVRKRHARAVEQLDKPGERPKAERPPGLPPQLAGKIQRIQRRVQEMQRDGQDVSPIVRVMQRLGPAVQAGRTTEAEQIVAEALKLLGEKDE